MKVWLKDFPGPRSTGTSMVEMSGPSGRASRWQVAPELAAGTTARMKYCSSMPANDAGPGPSQVGVFCPTPTRSSFPPAWQIERAGALVWLENQPPPEPDSPSPVERTPSRPATGFAARISTARSSRYVLGSTENVFVTVTPPAAERNTGERSSLRTTSYGARSGTTSPEAPARTVVASGNGSPGFGRTSSTGTSPPPFTRFSNFGPRSCADSITAPSEERTTRSLSERSTTFCVGGRGPCAAGGAFVSRGTFSAAGGAGAAFCSASVAAGACRGGVPAGRGLGWKKKLQITATAMQIATVRRSLRFWSFMTGSARRDDARSAGEPGRVRPRPTGGTEAAGRERDKGRPTVRASGSPPRRTASNSGNSGRPARGPGRRSAGRPRGARAEAGRGPARRVAPLGRRSPRSSAHAASREAQEGAELRHSGGRRRLPSGEDQIDRREAADLVTDSLAQPSLHAVAHDGVSHLGRHGDANARDESCHSRARLLRQTAARPPGRGERAVDIALPTADREEFAAAAQPAGAWKREGLRRVPDHDPTSSRRSRRVACGPWRGAA